MGPINPINSTIMSSQILLVPLIMMSHNHQNHNYGLMGPFFLTISMENPLENSRKFVEILKSINRIVIASIKLKDYQFTTTHCRI
jgi:hypothetical protein